MVLLIYPVIYSQTQTYLSFQKGWVFAPLQGLQTLAISSKIWMLSKEGTILDKQSYINEGQRQLHNTPFYEQTDSDHTGEVINRINICIHNIFQRGQISQSTCNYLTTDIDRTQQFHLLPKIHKDQLNPPGRPIASGSGEPTEKISQLVHHFIGQIVPLSQSYIRDSTHLIYILNGFTIQPGMLLCTLDITSLYTNIPHDEDIQSTKEMLAIYKPPDSLPHNSYIIELLGLVLTNNHFELNGKHYHQMSGTAMGTKLAPSYANLFMTNFEEKICIYISSTAKTMEEDHG